MTSAGNRPPTVAVIGALGHGLKHRRTVYEMQRRGLVELVAVASRRPVAATPDAPLDGVRVFTDHRRLLTEARPDVAIISTPPHTHLPIALDAARAGCDLLLEKPPVASVTEYRHLFAALAAYGVVCQVGFQALGSLAMRELVDTAASGALGVVGSVSGGGAWWRSESYYRRSAWAGRRTLDGLSIVDGAIANQFAHALTQCLALLTGTGQAEPPWVLELERYRAGDIDVEDTACLRVTTGNGRRLGLAVTLRAADGIVGDVVCHGDREGAVLEYPTDRIRLPKDRDFRPASGRIGLLENLLVHRAAPDVPLLAPLRESLGFTAIVQAVLSGPAPTPIPDAYLIRSAADDGWVIEGITPLVRTAIDKVALFSELGAGWSVAPHRRVIEASPR